MKFTIAQPIFKALVSVLSTVTKETRLQCTDNGLEAICVDPAHVAMVGFTIPKDAIKIEQWGTDDIGIDLDKINAFFKTTDAATDITVQVTANGRLVLSSGHITRSMNLIDTSSMATPKVPQFDTPAEVKATLDKLQSAIKGVQDIGDNVAVSVKQGTFRMVTEDEVNSAEFQLSAADGNVEIVGEDALSKFPLDYLSNAIKSIPSAFTATIHLGSDYPIKLDYTDGIVDGWYLIAPRIEEGDSE